VPTEEECVRLDCDQRIAPVSAAIIHRVESSARLGLTFRSWKSANCFRRNRFSADRALWERAINATIQVQQRQRCGMKAVLQSG
jgi:hypothetical protein